MLGRCVSFARQVSMTDASSPPSATDTAAASDRLSAIDVFRGLTILEVVGHHASGMALRHATPGSLTHDALTILNRSLHFAVPAFVFLSCVVLTNSLLRRFNPGQYYWRRLTRGGWPYLLWSVLYILWYVWTGQRDAASLEDPQRWWTWLAYGKGSYHLYFLLVALEVYLVLPLLLPLARRRPSVSVALLAGLAAQIGAYFLNKEVLHLQFPASTAFWYVLPITLGVAVGARFGEFEDWWRRRRVILLPLLAAAYALYLPVALAYVRGERVTPLIYSTLSWTFTALVALALMGLAHRLQRGPDRVRVAVATLGTVSLQIYLLHPAVLQALELWRAPLGPPALMLAQVVIYALVALLVPAILGRALLRTRLSTWVFGR
ncbi:putative acyltransferase [Deinococcus deserti VCD115]|uniref:Putative acyltransferase n=2 Tax=Deinococcus TaxID=1298 RepID=C1CUX4_DEIDV|nr:putative acyltransferase [Deinococcus deserti VCD115]